MMVQSHKQQNVGATLAVALLYYAMRARQENCIRMAATNASYVSACSLLVELE
jgi:hypothetical protein